MVSFLEYLRVIGKIPSISKPSPNSLISIKAKTICPSMKKLIRAEMEQTSNGKEKSVQKTLPS